MATGSGWRFNFSRLGTIDMVTGGATLVLFISLFLPWFGYYSFHRNGIGAHGYLFLVLLTSLALIAYLVYRAGWDDMPFRLPVAHAPLLLVVGVFDLLFVLLAFLTPPGSMGHSYGSWLALLASLGAVLPIGIAAVRSMQGVSPAGHGPAVPAYGGFAPAPGGAHPASGAMPTPPPPGAAGYPPYSGPPSATMGFGEAVRTVLGKYADFSGRARRSEYWWWGLAWGLSFFVAALLFAASRPVGILLVIVVMLGGLLPGLAVAVRRLHDTDRSGAWYLLSFVPFGGIVIFVFTVMEGTPGPNRYGPPPKPATGYPLPAAAYQPAAYGPGPGYPAAGYGQQPGYGPPPGYGPGA